MAGLTVTIHSHTNGGTVARWIGIWGSVSITARPTVTLGSVHIQLGAGGPWLRAQPDPNALLNWSWQGQLPNAVRPGDTFVVTISAQGTRRFRDGEGRQDSEKVDGEATRVLVLENKQPWLTMDPFHPTASTLGETAQVTLSGGVGHEGHPDIYFVPQLHYRVDNGPFVAFPSIAGRWSLPLTLARGQRSFEVKASDGFGSERSTGPRSVRVLTYVDSPRSVPNERTTPSGAATTSSVTSWTRIESEVAGADMGLSVALRVFDPVWMLTRQWQMGEYQGEDTGSPVKARIRTNSAMVSRWKPGALQAGNLAGLPYAPNAAPLEAMIEAVKTRAGGATEPSTLSLAIDAGLHFLRLLNGDARARKYVAAFRQRYVVEALAADAAQRLDAASRSLLASLQGRALDARRLVAALRSVPAAVPNIDTALGVTSADLSAVRAVASAWLSWHDALLHEPADQAASAWAPDRLEYTASVAASFASEPSANVTLTATQHEGGRLDWYSFDSEAALKLDTPGAPPSSGSVETVVPAPVHVHGTPTQRIWEFEDGHVAYGLIPTEPADIAQMMLAEYAGSYGNDWYVVPLTLPVGSLTRISSLVVVDTFGVQSLVRPMGDPTLAPPHFSMWQQSRRLGSNTPADDKEINLFFVPPTVGMPLESVPVEELHLVRDEMANIAWAIEVTREGATEKATRVADLPAQSPTAEGGPEQGDRYRLWSAVPRHWHPVLPVRHGQADQAGIRLKLGLTVAPDGSLRPIQAEGRILSALRETLLHDEEVARGGLHLSRRRKLTRWINGSTWLWSSIRTEVGRGEQSAQLRFDYVDEAK